MNEKRYETVFSLLSVLLLALIVVSAFVPKDSAFIVFPETKLAPLEASVTIDESTAPVIIDYSPILNDFSALGTQDLHFNASFFDMDNNVLSGEWFVDGNIRKITTGFQGFGFDEFDFNFGCEVSGMRDVRFDVSDGLNIASVGWDINVSPASCSSGGNGGNENGRETGETRINNFTLSRDLISVDLFQGENKRETVFVNNTGDTDLGFVLDIMGLEDFITLNLASFTLQPGNSRIVDINFRSSVQDSPGLYTGTLSFKAGGMVSLVNLIMEISDRGPLFDLKSELEKSVLFRGDKIDAKIKMTDISGLGKVDVAMEYFVKDFEDNEFQIGRENLIVNGALEIERSFDLPKKLASGNYVFYPILTYNGRIATSSSPFRLSSASFWYKFVTYLIGLVILLLFIILFIYIKKKKEEG